MTKTTVHVAADPFLARSAIQTFLETDDRFEAILVPASDGMVGTSDGEVVIVSGATPCSGSLVVRLLDADVEIAANGTTVLLPYNGLRWLADVIVSITDVEVTEGSLGGGGSHDP